MALPFATDNLRENPAAGHPAAIYIIPEKWGTGNYTCLMYVAIVFTISFMGLTSQI